MPGATWRSPRCWAPCRWAPGLALWAWSASPYARYVAHGGWRDSAAFAALCRAMPAGSVVVPAALSRAGLGADDRGDDAADDLPAARHLPRDDALGVPTPARLLVLVLAGFFVRLVRLRPGRACARRRAGAGSAAAAPGSSSTAGWSASRCSRRRGPVPVQRAQVPLPRAMPHAVRLRRIALARPARRRARRSASASTTASSASAAAGR